MAILTPSFATASRMMSEPGIEGDLGYDAAVGTAENDGERLLALGEHLATSFVATGALDRVVHKPLVSLPESLVRLVCGQLFHFVFPGELAVAEPEATRAGALPPPTPSPA